MRCSPRSTAGLAWAASELASSAHGAPGDDALKDFDNASWVLDLPPSIQPVWLQRIRAIRLADRLAENQQLDPASRRFDRFVTPALPDAFAGEGAAVLAAWTGYVAALRAYHRPDLRLRTLTEHRVMLDRLSGSLFQLVPFLSPREFEAIRALGAVDQFFNNLRDLAEDGAQGICYFPDDVLARAGMRRQDVLGDGWRWSPGWPDLMCFWLDEYLPELERAAAPFAACNGLHPSVARLRSECRARHLRILNRFRAVGLDFRRFAEEYWREVRTQAASAGR